MDQRKPTALLVEDDPALRKLVVGYLNLMGFRVIEAADGNTAMKRLEEGPLELVCLDLMLPESSGYDVCEFIRNNPGLRDLPIVMISARSLPEDRAHAEEVGASAYLVKPFTRAEFTREIQDVLARTRKAAP